MIPKFNTILQLIDRFPNEKACHQYLAGQRWNGYMECPYDDCDGDEAYVFKDGVRYKCKCCRRVYTAKTATVFESSKIDLQKWFVAIFLLMHKKGISSVQLSKDIGVTQKTAWFMLQRLRTALGNDKEDAQLQGVVEIDETFVGGKQKNRHKNKRVKYAPGRGWPDKTPVFGMLQRDGKLKAFVVPNVLMLTLTKMAYRHIKGGTDIMGDGFNGYRGLEPVYNMQNVDHGHGLYVNGDCHVNTLEGAWSQLKRSVIGIYHHVTRKHMQKYVNEFVFRYNCRNLGVQEQMNIFIKNMDCRLKYKDLIAA